MDYTVGSLAELISGKNVPNKTNLQKVTTEKKLTKEPKTEESKKGGKILKAKSPKLKTKLKKKIEKNATTTERNFVGKRKLDNISSPHPPVEIKKLKLSRNEENAANRIKNKINKENKTSPEYNSRTVFIGNIPKSIKKEVIKKHFRKYGMIESIRIRGIAVANPNTSKKVAAITNEFHPDRNTVHAYIRFRNSEDAKKAEAENGELFEGHHLRVHSCEDNDKPDETKAIFIGNLSFKAEEEELWNIFKTCGPISHVRIVRDGRTGMGKGFGYVNFKDSDAVQLALEMENVKLRDRELRISICSTNSAKKNKKNKKVKNTSEEDKRNEDEASKPKKSKSSGQFAGTKSFNKKKKNKFNKGALKKKKLAETLTATKSKVENN